jgi:hypothetical protein
MTLDDKELMEYVDQQRWLMNNGLISDSVKNQLFFCGSIIHKDVQAVELEIKPEIKLLNYTIYFNKDVLDKIKRYGELSTATSVFRMWQFKRFLKKEGSMDFQQILSKFVSDFLGTKWTTNVQVKNFADYIEGFGEQGGNPEPSQRLDKSTDAR